jgi:hypothetical protein
MDRQNRFRLARSPATVDMQALIPAVRAGYSGFSVEPESEMGIWVGGTAAIAAPGEWRARRSGYQRSVNAFHADGSLGGETVTTTSDDGLTKTIGCDYSGDWVFNHLQTDATVVNADGSLETMASLYHAGGPVRDRLRLPRQNRSDAGSAAQHEARHPPKRGSQRYDRRVVIFLTTDGFATPTPPPREERVEAPVEFAVGKVIKNILSSYPLGALQHGKTVGKPHAMAHDGSASTCLDLHPSCFSQDDSIVAGLGSAAR